MTEPTGTGDEERQPMKTANQTRLISTFLAFAMILASCGQSEESSPASTVPTETVTETTLASEPVTTTEEASTVEEPNPDETDDQDPDGVDNEPDDQPDDEPDSEEPGLPDGDWRSSPLADAILDPAEMAAAIGGTWTAETPELTEPSSSTSSTCGVTDPPSFDGIQAGYLDETNNIELVQIIQVGEGVDAWIAAFESLVDCQDAGANDINVDLIDVAVDGADSSAVVFSFDGSEEGYASGGAAMRGDVMVGLIAFSDNDGDELPSPEAVAALLSATLGEAVVLANTEPGGASTSPVMALTEADLADAGLSSEFEQIRLEEFDADTAAESWNGEPCTLVDSSGFDGFSTELVGPFGDPRIVQIVNTGPGVDVWIEALEGQSGCAGEPEGLPVVRADLWVQGAEQAMVLSPDGVDAQGTSYSVAAGYTDEVAVVIIVFADTPDDPALDSRVVSELAAIALARR